ncbi:hypothetical protein Tco_1171874 [Tanacetum coccineum]
MDRRCAAFENGISESFNRAILGPRMKPIITMLEEIRLYIMQRLVTMNKLAFSLEDTITPSIRKRLKILKEKQRMWELSGIPCVHAVAAYIHVGYDLDAGVSHWYSRESWFNAYQFSIKLVFGTNMWKRTNDCASRGGGRSGRGDGNDGSGSGVNDASGSGVNVGSASGVTDGSGSGERGGGRAGGSGGRGGARAGGRGGGRAGGSGKRGGGRAGRGSERGGVFPSSSSYGILTAEHEYQLELDEQAFREYVDEAPEQEISDDGPAVDKGKAKASVEDGPAPEQGISIEDGPAPKKENRKATIKCRWH